MRDHGIKNANVWVFEDIVGHVQMNLWIGTHHSVQTTFLLALLPCHHGVGGKPSDGSRKAQQGGSNRELHDRLTLMKESDLNLERTKSSRQVVLEARREKDFDCLASTRNKPRVAVQLLAASLILKRHHWPKDLRGAAKNAFVRNELQLGMGGSNWMDDIETEPSFPAGCRYVQHTFHVATES